MKIIYNKSLRGFSIIELLLSFIILIIIANFAVILIIKISKIASIQQNLYNIKINNLLLRNNIHNNLKISKSFLLLNNNKDKLLDYLSPSIISQLDKNSQVLLFNLGNKKILYFIINNYLYKKIIPGRADKIINNINNLQCIDKIYNKLILLNCMVKLGGHKFEIANTSEL